MRDSGGEVTDRPHDLFDSRIPDTLLLLSLSPGGSYNFFHQCSDFGGFDEEIVGPKLHPFDRSLDV